MRKYKLKFKNNFKKAFTLIELMVSIVIGLIAISLVLVLYNGALKNYYHQDMMIERNQNMRVASENLGRDIRSAGNGFDVLGVQEVQIAYNQNPNSASNSWFRHESSLNPGLLPIYGVNDVETRGSDSLSLSYFTYEYPFPIGGLLAEFTPGGVGSNQLTIPVVDEGFLLNPTDRALNAMGEPSIVAVVSGRQAVLLKAAATSNLVESKASSSKYNFDIKFLTSGRDSIFPSQTFADAELGGNLTFLPVISSVYNMRDLIWNTYFIDRTNIVDGQDDKGKPIYKPTLMVNKHFNPYRLQDGIVTTEKQNNKQYANKSNKLINLNNKKPIVLAANNLKHVSGNFVVSDAGNTLLAQAGDDIAVTNIQNIDTYAAGDFAVIADNIEDFQVRYYLNNNNNPVDSIANTIKPGTFTTTRIEGVEIGLVGLTRTPLLDHRPSKPLPLFDNTKLSAQSAEGDTFSRSVLVDFFTVRNQVRF